MTTTGDSLTPPLARLGSLSNDPAYADIQRRLVNIENQLSWLVSSAKRLEAVVERARKGARAAAAVLKHVKW